jgi:hypothetical protein
MKLYHFYDMLRLSLQRALSQQTTNYNEKTHPRKCNTFVACSACFGRVKEKRSRKKGIEHAAVAVNQNVKSLIFIKTEYFSSLRRKNTSIDTLSRERFNSQM